jgi:hypothetical protein
MGCDIHLHIEIKINGKWHHYQHPNVSRNYRLFSLMADVRNDERDTITPIAKPRGFPKDATTVTRFDKAKWDADGHSHSWLSAGEVAEMIETREAWDYARTPQEKATQYGASDLFGWLFGNSYSGFIKYPGDNPKGLEDFRFVFWFDN